jgi:hypothetical protein
VRSHQASSTWGSLVRKWKNIPEVSVSHCQGAVINANEAHDRNHIFHPPFPDIQFNFESFVNKIMLKIKDHWTINIVDYIPEIIMFTGSKNKFIIQKIFRHCVFKFHQYT